MVEIYAGINSIKSASVEIYGRHLQVSRRWKLHWNSLHR